MPSGKFNRAVVVAMIAVWVMQVLDTGTAWVVHYHSRPGTVAGYVIQRSRAQALAPGQFVTLVMTDVQRCAATSTVQCYWGPVLSLDLSVVADCASPAERPACRVSAGCRATRN
jgi:hypothetical protein